MGYHGHGASLEDGGEESIMKKMSLRTKAYILISISAAFFVYLFIRSLMDLLLIFTNLAEFDFTPALLTVFYLIILFFHVALYIMYMDKKDATHQVVDDDEWWTRWDQV